MNGDLRDRDRQDRDRQDWDRQLTTALLGTRRRPFPGEDPAGRLLDLAAVATVRRRAGRLPADAVPVAPAPVESAPVVNPAAAARLARILAGEQPRALPEWLRTAAHHGHRVPPRLLPDLLEKGRSERALRPFIAQVCGRRGMWLALMNPGWAYLVNEPSPDPATGGEACDLGGGPGGPGATPDRALWETGTRGRRVAHLRRLRRADPAAALELLRSTWVKEPAPDRTALLETLRLGLSPADEPFLEDALDDRAKDVRGLAAELLARLPDTRYARRMTARARACLRAELRVVRGRAHHWIVVEPPHVHDEGMLRDGVPFHPAGSFAPKDASQVPVGARAGWLREILARTPLATWTDVFAVPPMEVVCLPIADDFATDVHIGWARAAVRQRDTAWARALLKGGVLIGEVEALADLLTVLPGDERDAAAADLIRWADGYPEVQRALERIPGPWTGRLADAVVAALVGALESATRPGGEGPRQVTRLCRLADERLTPAAAPRLEELTTRHPDFWPLSELTGTLRFRHDMLAELGPPG